MAFVKKAINKVPPAKFTKETEPPKIKNKTSSPILKSANTSLLGRLKKASKTELAGIMSEYDDIKPRDFISSGNYLFNCLLTADPFKGVPSGKIITLAGPPGSGKCHSFNTEIEIFVEEENLKYFNSSL